MLGCLGTPPPEEEALCNMDTQTANNHSDEVKSPDTATLASAFSFPRLASLNSISKQILSADPADLLAEDYQFVFRDRRVTTCRFEPYKVLLLIASAQGYHHDADIADADSMV